MTQLYQSRLLCRYPSIQRLRRRPGMVDGNSFGACRRGFSEPSSRSFATFSRDQKFPPNPRFQLSTRPIRFRRHQLASRCFSDLNSLRDDAGKESIDDGHDLSASIDLSLDDNASSDESDSLALFFDAFPQMVDNNVNEIILKVDNSSLKKRWQQIFKKEKEWHLRRNRVKSNKKKFNTANLSIEEQWNQALQRKGYCIARRMSSEEEQYEKSSFDMLELEHDHSELDERHEFVNDTILSPIFGLPFDEEESYLDFEMALAAEQNEENDDLNNYFGVQRMENLVDDDDSEEDRSKMHSNAILKSISLLIAMRREDWRKYDSSVHLSTDTKTRDNIQSKGDDDDANQSEINGSENKTHEFLQHVMEHKSVLTTSILNLFLAHLLTSNEIDNQEVADSCLQVFEEMKILRMSGRYDCQPDSTTYRLLILAFSRRFQAIGEALKISQEMVEHSSIDISPGLFNEALRVCREKTELNVARMMMDSAMRKDRIRINAASCIIYTEMLKTGKLDEEAVDLFSRIKKAKLLTLRDEDEYLTCLCRWPQRSRRGDVIDLSSFWNQIRDILEERTQSGKIPHIRVWLTFLQGLYDSAKNDDSLWQIAADGTRMVLDAYPRHFMGSKLMTIGLDASFRIEDAQLMALIFNRLANEPSISTESPSLPEDDSETSVRPAKIPFRALKNSLLICLKTSDAKSAQSILDSMNQIGDPYPVGAKYELYSLVLKCHAKVNDAENTTQFLQKMVENNMKPSEELYSDVLRTMAAAGNYEEMEELFQSMQTGTEDGIEPGISSYDAVISARIQEQNWDEVFVLYDEMKEREVRPSSYTIKGLLTANNEKEGRNSVASALESLLLSSAQFDESAFRLASKILFQDVDNNLDDFRKIVREIGERNQELRDSSLDLVRSIRSAEVESSRPSKQPNGSENQGSQHAAEEAWRQAISNLLVFSQAFLEAK